MSGNTSNFQRLSDVVHIRKGSSSSKDSTDVPIVLVATWMNAPPRLIGKYATSIVDLFPESDIVLLTNTSSHLFSNDVKPLYPALDHLLGAIDRPVVGIAYSNGGLRALTKLATEYRKQTGKALPVRRLVLDSAPGSNEIKPAYIAFSSSLPPVITKAVPPIPWIFQGLIWIAICLTVSTYRILGKTDPITAVRQLINDPQFFQDHGTKRVYICGKKDLVVPYRAVLSSAAEAKEKGWDVTVETFDGKHVAHAVAEKERYWTLVEQTLKGE